MNRDSVLEMLLAVFADFWIHSGLTSDIVPELSRSGYEDRFFSLLLARLKFLRAFGVKAIQHEEFEALSGAKNIYSMHLAGQGFNYRILYSFSPQGVPILLVGFNKRSGKRHTDYDAFIPVAERRLNEELEAHKND